MFRKLFLFLFPLIVISQELLENQRCNHYPERGTCETHFEIKWYYDRFDHRCRRFFYGGCDGNDNRFDTLNECEQQCHFDPQIEETSSRRCFQKHDPGNCFGNFERWYFDSTVGRCICSWWSGCGGNSNRFYSYPHCMSICGEYAVDKTSIEKQEPSDMTVYKTPLSRMSKAVNDTKSTPSTYYQSPVISKPVNTKPLGGGILYENHVMTPVHPPIYDDPDLINITPVQLPEIQQKPEVKIEDENYETDEEYDLGELPEDPDPPMVINNQNTQEWSAKTATRFFPHLVKPLPKFPEKEPPKESYDAMIEGSDSSKEIVETSDPNKMLLDLKPPDGYIDSAVNVSKSRKRETKQSSNNEIEILETQFRTNHRRSIPKNVEKYETTYKKLPRQTRSDNINENYETPYVRNNYNKRHQKPLIKTRTSKQKTLYNEFAETPFIRHSYVNPPIFPGYPILRGFDEQGKQIIPQPIHQDLINQLIQQHLALRLRQIKDKTEVVETPYRRIPGTNGNPSTLLVKIPESITYEEKRRRWKEKMKKKLRGNKIPSRPLIPFDGKKYYVTYSPYYRLYQVSRDPPYGFWKNNSNSNIKHHIKIKPPPLFTIPTTTIPTTTTTTTTTSAPPTTKKPLSIALPAEELQIKETKQSIRLAATKNIPTTKLKHLIYLDDYDENVSLDPDIDNLEDEKDNDETVSTDVKSSPTPIPSNSVQSNNGFNAIVYPPNYKPKSTPSTTTTTTTTTTNIPSTKSSSSDHDYIMPKENDEDYFDYGQSDEDLYFWKPGYDPRRHQINNELSRVNPESDAFEITVHQPEDVKKK